MTDIEKIVKIIENYSPELAAEEILRLFSVSNCTHEKTGYHKMNVKYCYDCKTIIKIDV